ncbi:MAG: DUF5074 domain-containing protein [Mucilaginibacter sp.]
MKYLQNLKLCVTVAVLAIIAVSCHKVDKIVAPTTPPQLNNFAGIYVLNQGNSGANNSVLSYFDFSTWNSWNLMNHKFTIFSLTNNINLGDTGNDAEIYGSKMFVTVTNSNIIDVMEAKTAKLIKQININQPRSIVFVGSNAFVTSYQGTVSIIDTAALTINKIITVGSYPEQMVVSNNKLYVANSGINNPPVYNNTVSVIDLAGLTVIKTITVSNVNPFSMAADTYGHVYVGCLGDNKKMLPSTVEIDNTTDAVVLLPDLNLAYGSPLVVSGDLLYYTGTDFQVSGFDCKHQTITKPEIFAQNTFGSAIAVNNDTGEVFVASALNKLIYTFDNNRQIIYQINTGINPVKVLLVKK